MSSPQIPFNFIPTEPRLSDALALLRKDVMLSLNCHAIGTIQDFDITDQTATATINYPKTYFEPDEQGIYQPVLVNYPVLLDCPAIVLGGGSGALTFPIQKGDECLVLFNDRDLDNWFQGGTGAAVATPRLHSFSDALILVGLRSLPNVLSKYDPKRAALRGGAAVVGANTANNKVLISNATPSVNPSTGDLTYASTLLTAIQALVSAINGMTIIAPPGGGTCSIVPISTPTDFGDLLE